MAAIKLALPFDVSSLAPEAHSCETPFAYADTTEEESSAASSIASTMQQMSISFDVATAGLATAFFIPGTTHSSPAEMIHGIHKALLALGVL
jgi:hypothetical protein